jgi:hypothetical protein
MIEGETIIEYEDSDLGERVKNIWEKISARIRK